MKCCLSDLRYKEVIDQSTGQRLGYVCDAEIDLDDGKIVSLIVPGQKKLGGLLSGAVMLLLKRTRKFSLLGVSIAGGIAHNVGQILVAMVVVENMSIAYYMPVLLISGVITGCLIGIAAGEAKRRLPGMNAGRQED